MAAKLHNFWAKSGKRLVNGINVSKYLTPSINYPRYHQLYSFCATAQQQKPLQHEQSTTSNTTENDTNSTNNMNDTNDNDNNSDNTQEMNDEDDSSSSQQEQQEQQEQPQQGDEDDVEYIYDPAYDHLIHGVYTRRDYDRQTGRASKQIARLGRLYLYQYNVCPFCNKVKTVLDYYNVPYSLIEVSPVSKKQLPNSIHFLHDRTVPVLLTAKVNEGLHISSHKVLYQSNIILKNLLQYFVTHNIIEQTEYERNNSDIVNAWIEWFDNTLIPHLYAYIVAANNDNSSQSKSNNNKRNENKENTEKNKNDLKERMLKENISVSRDSDELLYQMFDYLHDFKKFQSLGLTSKPIQALCVMMFKNQAAKICYKYGIESGNEKEALKQVLNEWANVVKITFHGGTKPDLADLTGYAVLNTFANLHVIDQLLNETGLIEWYETVEELVGKNCCVTHA